MGEGHEQAARRRLRVNGKHISTHWLNSVLNTTPPINRHLKRNVQNRDIVETGSRLAVAGAGGREGLGVTANGQASSWGEGDVLPRLVGLSVLSTGL